MAARSFFNRAKEGTQSSSARAQGVRVPPDARLQPRQSSGLCLLVANLWTTEQVRERLNLGSTDSVLRLVRDERLPRVRVGGKFRYVPAQVEAWLQAQNEAVVAALKIVGRT